jgi:hypothetical protein
MWFVVATEQPDQVDAVLSAASNTKPACRSMRSRRSASSSSNCACHSDPNPMALSDFDRADRRHAGRPAAGAAALRSGGRHAGRQRRGCARTFGSHAGRGLGATHRRRAQPLPAGLHRQRHDRLGRRRRRVDELGPTHRGAAGVSIATGAHAACRCGPTTCSRCCTGAAGTKWSARPPDPACSAQACRAHEILYSTAILKKTGLRLTEN